MLETLEYATQLRPTGHWGFYGFPRCYNYKKGQKRCPTNDMEYNNEYLSIFDTNLSIYFNTWTFHNLLIFDCICVLTK